MLGNHTWEENSMGRGKVCKNCGQIDDWFGKESHEWANRTIPWRERKLRCKLGIHAAPKNWNGGYPYACRLCGTRVKETSVEETYGPD